MTVCRHEQQVTVSSTTCLLRLRQMHVNNVDFGEEFLNIYELQMCARAGIAQSTQRLATGWKVRGSNPGGGEVFRTRPDLPWEPVSLFNGYRRFLPPGLSGRSMKLTTHPHAFVAWNGTVTVTGSVEF